jgi:coenzyme F420-reducing hydrogenase delta subunit
VNRIKQLLAQIGLEPERIEMFNMSAAMAGEFVARAAVLTETIAALGPSRLRAIEPISIPMEQESKP